MTLHSAKGLEFPYVYLCGMEDGLFPSYMSINGDDPTEVEEERRLAYVGITRAMKELYLSCARSRMVRGETQFNRPSRFVREIPRHLLKESAGNQRTLGTVASRYESGFRPSGRYGGSDNTDFGYSSRGGYEANGYQSGVTRGMRTATNDMMANGTLGSSRMAKSRSTASASTGTNRGGDIFAGNPLISKGFGAGKTDYNVFDKPKSSSTPSKEPYSGVNYAVGDTVKHIKFGTGVVTGLVEKAGDHEVTVEFESSGVKKMKASFAKLKKLS